MADYTSLGQLLQNREAGYGSRGGEALGEMLGGGNALRRQQIYNQAASQGALMADRMQQARQRQQDEAYKQTQRGNRQRASEEFDKQGNHLGALLLGGYENPNEAAQAQINFQKAQQIQDAWAARNGDMNALNRMLMVTEGKPQALTKIEENTVVNPLETPDRQSLATTQLGQALIGLHGAQAGAANAAAGEHVAQAEHAYAGAGAERALEDQRRGKLGSMMTKPTPLTAAAEKVFNVPVNDEAGAQKMDSQGRPVYQTDIGKMKDFQQFVGTRSPDNPQLNNQNAALSQYLTEYGAQNDAQPPGSFTLGDAVNSAGKAPAKIPVAKKMVNGKLWYKYNDGTTAPAED